MWTVQTPCEGPELRCNQMMATTNVSEREARQVAEAAREQEWKLPSFGKELFLGNFRLDLIHPQPRLDDEATEKGERFLAELQRLPRERGRPAPDRARREAPRRGRRGPQADRRDGHEGRRGVRRPRALAGLLQPRAGDGRRVARGDRDAALRAPVDRRRRAAADVRDRRAEARVAAEGGAHRTSRRSCSPSPTSARTRPAWPPPPSRWTAATSSTGRSCGRPTARSPTSSS